MKKILLLILYLTLISCSAIKRTSKSNFLDELYLNLKTNFSNADNTFYSKPVQANITDFIHTPNFWNKNDANLPYFLQNTYRLNQDSNLLLPICNVDDDCISDNPSKVEGKCVFLNAAHKKLCIGHSDQIIDTIYNSIINANSSVDIALFDGNGAINPDQRFIGLLHNAIQELAQSSKNIIIRIIVGIPNGGFIGQTLDPKIFIKQLTHNISANNIKVYVGTSQTCHLGYNCIQSTDILDSISHNHSKIILIDNHKIITGGHNMVAVDYLMNSPIYDLSYTIDSPPIGITATNFLNQLWLITNKHVNDSHFSINGNKCASFSKYGYAQDCLIEIAPNMTYRNYKNNSISMPISSSGIGLTKSNEAKNLSSWVLNYTMLRARKNINIIQQDLGILYPPYIKEIIYDSSFINILAAKAINNVKIDIVTTNQGAFSASDTYYSNHVPITDVAAKIYAAAVEQFKGNMNKTLIKKQLCNNIYLSTIHYSPNYNTWSNGNLVGLHSKLYSIDKHIFYIGSANAYPINLQEFGIINDSSCMYQKLNRVFISQVLENSKPYSISGLGISQCVFDKFD